MDAEFAFSTIHDAVLQLRAAAMASGVKLYPLPYRRFDPEAEDTWWLTSDPKNPAYDEGKIVVERPMEAAPGRSLMGLHIEKGVGPRGAPMFETSAHGARMVMARDWTWHPFVRAMKSGSLDKELAVAEAAAGELPLLFAIRSAVQALPRLEQDEHGDRDDAELIWFRPSGEQLKREGDYRADVIAKILGQTESLASIAETIERIPDIDWRWVELWAGVPFARGTEGALTASEVWRRACAPCVSWLR